MTGSDEEASELRRRLKELQKERDLFYSALRCVETGCGDPTQGVCCALCGEDEHAEPRHREQCAVGFALRGHGP